MRSGACPRILFIVDLPNWAHDFKATNLKRTLESDYEIRKRYQFEVTPADIDEANLILVYHLFQFEEMGHLQPVFERNRRRLLLGVCSHSELEGGRGAVGISTLRSLARCVFTTNLLLYRECKRLFDVPVFYTPNGVDTSFYVPPSRREDGRNNLMRVGWAGSLLNHGHDHRGYNDLIVPAVNSVSGIELLTAAREEKWRSPEEMREFYQSLDLYLCASISEGAPNTCLEAAACGVPLLTTPVGNMPELVRPGINGFFIERDIGDIRCKLSLLRDDATLRESMGREIRQNIQAWDWSTQSNAYREMFEEMLNHASTESSASLKAGAEVAVTTAEQTMTEPKSAGEDLAFVKQALLGRAKESLALISETFYQQHRDIDITVVMLSHGRLDRTLNAIRSLKDHVRIPFKLLLIDNNSDIETKDKLREAGSAYDFIELILLGENLGCAGGRMHALAHVATEYLMFLDNDIEVLPGTIEHLLHTLEEHPDIVGAAGNVILPDGSVHLCGGDYRVENDLLHLELLGAGRRFEQPLGHSGTCPWIPGGLAVLRRDFLVRYPYDSSLGSYYEDLEWCYRLNRLGVGNFWRSVESLAIHYHEPKIPDSSLPPAERRQQVIRYVEAIAHFYKVHGKVIASLFAFVPELGLPGNKLSVLSGKLLLELVNSFGGEWLINKWNNNQLAPLFLATELSDALTQKDQLGLQVIEQRTKIDSLSGLVAERQESVDSLAAQLAEKAQLVESLSLQLAQTEQGLQALTAQDASRQHALRMLSTQLAEKTAELDRITNTFGWRLLRLYGKIKYPYLLPIYRLLGFARRKSKPARLTDRKISS